MPANLFDGFRQSAAADGPAWLKGFLDLFYNIDKFRGNRVSDEARWRRISRRTPPVAGRALQ